MEKLKIDTMADFRGTAAEVTKLSRNTNIG